MKLTIQFKDYLRAQRELSNSPVSVQTMLKPFGITDAPSQIDETLLVGHILDALSEEFLEPESIDPLDVLRVLDDLGSPLTF